MCVQAILAAVLWRALANHIDPGNFRLLLRTIGRQPTITSTGHPEHTMDDGVVHCAGTTDRVGPARPSLTRLGLAVRAAVA